MRLIQIYFWKCLMYMWKGCWRISLFISHVLNMLKSETSYLNNVFSIGDLNIVNIHILLWGKDKLSKTVTDHMFSLVYIFIWNQKDFNYVFTFASKCVIWYFVNCKSFWTLINSSIAFYLCVKKKFICKLMYIEKATKILELLPNPIVKILQLYNKYKPNQRDKLLLIFLQFKSRSLCL